jgi:hypothetical protein
MAAGGDRVRARNAPVLAPVVDLEAGSTQAIEGSLEVVDDHRQVAAGRHRGIVLRHQMDLGAAALQPGELGEGRRWLDPFEAEQLEELDRVIDVSRPDLYSDVMQHRLKVTETAPACNVLSAGVCSDGGGKEAHPDDARWDDFRRDVDKRFGAEHLHRSDDRLDRDPGLTRFGSVTSEQQ